MAIYYGRTEGPVFFYIITANKMRFSDKLRFLTELNTFLRGARLGSIFSFCGKILFLKVGLWLIFFSFCGNRSLELLKFHQFDSV